MVRRETPAVRLHGAKMETMIVQRNLLSSAVVMHCTTAASSFRGNRPMIASIIAIMRLRLLEAN